LNNISGTSFGGCDYVCTKTQELSNFFVDGCGVANCKANGLIARPRIFSFTNTHTKKSGVTIEWNFQANGTTNDKKEWNALDRGRHPNYVVKP
jgi:hypothetical protein